MREEYFWLFPSKFSGRLPGSSFLVMVSSIGGKSNPLWKKKSSFVFLYFFRLLIDCFNFCIKKLRSVIIPTVFQFIKWWKPIHSPRLWQRRFRIWSGIHWSTRPSTASDVSTRPENTVTCVVQVQVTWSKTLYFWPGESGYWTTEEERIRS